MGRTPNSRDPRQQQAKTPFPEQEQRQPGFTAEMRPKPDHGEETRAALPLMTAQPTELAPACVYLASDDSSYVTASIMDLTGGRMLR